MKDVARAAGVSIGTVSNVLNRPDLVSETLRLRVEDVIAEMGFVRNESARQLRAGSSRTIAVVVLDLANPYFTDVAAGVESAADAHGGLVVVCNSAGDPVREEQHLARLEEQRVQGVLLTPVLDIVTPLALQLQERGTPVVLLDRVSDRDDLASVSVDDVRGGGLAGEHLLERGHRRVAFAGGPARQRQVGQRLAGLRAAGGGALEVHVVETSGLSVRAGAQAVAQLHAGSGPLPTALFCANDLLALGALNECLRRGVRVPDDLALVGYDDIAFAGTAPVPLTSVRQPREQLGRTAVELLTEQLPARGGPVTGPARHVCFEPELVARESTRVRRPPG